MALSTVDIQKLKGTSSELGKIYTGMNQQLKKLDEAMATLDKLWKGEGAAAYQAAYRQNQQNFVLLAEAINSCSASLTTIANTYGKADMAAADTIKSKMGGRK